MGGSTLEGKVVIITGAASGFGAGAALKCLQQGAKVVMADRNEPLLLATCADLKEKTRGEAMTVVADVAKDDDNRRIVETTMSTFGALHMSFINAGVAISATLEAITEEVVESVFGPNFKSVVFGLKHQIPAIAKTWEKGSIVVSSSVAGTKVLHMFPGLSLYACSKAALEMMVKYGAVEGAPMKVRVNAIAPTTVRTPLAKGIVGDVDDEVWKAPNLINKEVTIEHVISLVMFLFSDDSEAVTGSVVPCDMGALIKT